MFVHICMCVFAHESRCQQRPAALDSLAGAADYWEIPDMHIGKQI